MSSTCYQRFSQRSIISLVLVSCSIIWQVQAQYPNIRVSPFKSTDPEEVTIAINPMNPLNIVAGANITKYYYSTNGGLNWNHGDLTSPYGVWGDPCLTFDALGNLYYGHLSNPPSAGYWIDRIVVQRSTDGGASWNNGAGIGFAPPRKNQDKDWLAADMTDSPYKNNLYVAWTEFDSYGSSSHSDSSRILMSRSTNAGITWSDPVRVSDRAGDCIDSDNTDEGAVPAIGPQGEVYLTWSGPLGIEFDKSTDGGVTWGKDVFVSDQPGGWDYMIPGINRCNGLPVTACDVSHSAHRGTIYVNWTDQRHGLDNTDVFIATSSDGGATWSPAKQVNDDLTVAQQFFTWMTIDQATGYVYVVFYDRRATEGTATDVYMARSTDGGATFTNFKVSEYSFTPTSTIFFGDYTNIAAYNGKVYPIWTRLDGNALSVWIAIVDDSVATRVPLEKGYASSFELLQNYPNPFNPSTMIQFNIPVRAHVTLKVYDVVGEKIETLIDRVVDSGEHTVVFSALDHHLASGVYFYRMTAGRFFETKKFVLLQ